MWTAAILVGMLALHLGSKYLNMISVDCSDMSDAALENERLQRISAATHTLWIMAALAIYLIGVL